VKYVRRLVTQKQQMNIFSQGLYIELACGHHKWGDPYGREGKLAVNKSKTICSLCSRHAVGIFREDETACAMTLAEQAKKNERLQASQRPRAGARLVVDSTVGPAVVPVPKVWQEGAEIR
jgi:hypothetical protein